MVQRVQMELWVPPAPRDRKVIQVRKVLLASKDRRATLAIRVLREFRVLLVRLARKVLLV